MGRSRKKDAKHSKESKEFYGVATNEVNQVGPPTLEFDEAKYEIWESRKEAYLQAHRYDIWHSIISGDMSTDEYKDTIQNL